MLHASDSPHSKYPHVYAIVRFDLDVSGENGVKVVKVIPSPELAEQETERLNKVNKGKQCIYRVQTTRFVESPEPDG
jgi:hypothetical protein